MAIFSVDSNIPHLDEIITSQAQHSVNIFSNGNISRERLLKTETQFLIVRSTIKVNEKLLKDTNVKFVATATTGTDHVDKEYLKRNNIQFYAPIGANSNSVAEYVIYSILYANRNNLESLRDKTVGIIGFGNIGTKVAHYLSQMNINYLVCDPFVAEANTYPNQTFIDIDKLVGHSNIITLHIPLTSNGPHPTIHLIGGAFLEQMKDNTLLINAARGAVCDSAAMLSHRHRLNYIVDCWFREPFVSYRSLLNYTIIATPHIAGHSFNAKCQASTMICEEINKLYQLGLPIEPHVFDSEFKPEMLAHDNFLGLLDMIQRYREINLTSETMKKNVELDGYSFKEYFEDARENYPQRYEFLKIF